MFWGVEAGPTRPICCRVVKECERERDGDHEGGADWCRVGDDCRLRRERVRIKLRVRKRH